MKALVLAAVALAAPAGKPFNLECRGSTEVVQLGGVTTSSYTRTLRVDLAAGQWCADACKTVEPIAKAEPQRLTFRETAVDTPRRYWRESESVDRVTGAHSSMAGNNPKGPLPRTAFSKGQCEVRPFTGFGGEHRRF